MMPSCYCSSNSNSGCNYFNSIDYGFESLCSWIRRIFKFQFVAPKRRKKDMQESHKDDGVLINHGGTYIVQKCTKARFTLEARSHEDKISANGRPKIEKTKECHFTPEIFSPRDAQRRNDMDSTFVLRGRKSCTFFKSPGICIKPAFQGGPDTNSGGLFGQNSHSQSFFYFLRLFQNSHFY
jgi:hypothetical protein